MKKDLNLGVAKAIVSNTITNEFLNESKLEKSKGLMNNLVKTITKSEVLVNEYTIFANLENKHILNENIAIKFIDKNIGKLSQFSQEEIHEAHEYLNDFISEEYVEQISESKLNLYNSINTLLVESNNVDGDIDKIHVAYENVLTHIKENVKDKNTEPTFEFLDENINIGSVVEVATAKFNEKYSSLNENERDLVNMLVYGSTEDKKNLFEELKLYNIGRLNLVDTNGVEDKINEAIEKVNNMTYSEKTISKDIIELQNLKENLN